MQRVLYFCNAFRKNLAVALGLAVAVAVVAAAAAFF